MRNYFIGTWLVSEMGASDTPVSIHFVCAQNKTKALQLVGLKKGLPLHSLEATLLKMDERALESHEEALKAERYLGALQNFSPHRRLPCAFCKGNGKIKGSFENSTEVCKICNGSGLKTTRRK